MSNMNTRLWRCPECGEVERIAENEPDPTLCDLCLSIAKTGTPTVDDEKKSILPSSNKKGLLPSKYVIIATSCVLFGCVLFTVVGGIITSIASLFDDAAPYPDHATTSSVESVSERTETERKVIYRAIMSAFAAAARDSEYGRLESQIIQHGVSIDHRYRMSQRQNEIDGEYLKRLVWDRFGITEIKQIEIYVEGIKKRWSK